MTGEHMTDEELRAIQERCDKASPGPWKAWVEGRDHVAGSSMIQTSAEDIEMTGATTEDYDFIAHARSDVPALLAEVRRLRGLVGGEHV
jgi:predicted oxidoreductase